MSHPSDTPIDERVLVLAPTAADAALTRTLLAEAGLGCSVCADLAGLCREFGEGGGVILVTEEVLADGEADDLVEALRQQPPWSDVPILLLAGSGADSPVAAWAMDRLGNVTVLERPVRVTTLVSALRAALRARRRQYELRRQVEALRSQGERLRLLWEAASVLLSMDQPEPMMRGLFARIAPHLGLDAYCNFTVDEAGDGLRMESCLGVPDEEAGKIDRLDFEQAICGMVALHRRPITAASIQRSDDPRAQLIKGYGIRAYACNPLMAGDRLLGTLSFASRTRDHFEADELEFLQTVCHYVAYAYERLRLIRRLREEDRRKDEFLAMLAHELRNPLAPIRNAVSVMGMAEDDREARRWIREVIDRQVRHLTSLVDDLLDVSRITQGKITLTKAPLAVASFVHAALESSRPMIEARRHALEVELPDGPLRVDGDLTRLSQVVLNLLNNAAKYTPEGGHIRLTAGRDGGRAVIRVADDGEGITLEMLPRVFDLFSQASRSIDRSQGGLGIGLTLVRRLVEMHGGTVEAHSEGPGRGSEFVMRLPLLEAAPVTPAEPGRRGSPGGPGGRPRRVLVVDDRRDSADTLSRLLQGLGHEVRAAYDGPSACEAALAFSPDIVLLDIGLPGLDGYEVARRLRAEPSLDGVCLVALTGYGGEADRRQGEDAGFDAHLVKPVEFDALRRVLEATQVGSSGGRIERQ